MNEKNSSKIDVIIPVFNGEKFILEAIQSAANQKLTPNKIIVIDDGSTDSTKSLVEEYSQKSSIEIKLVTKANGGLSSARNAGIRESGSDFIAFLDADDIWLPNKLTEQIKIYTDSEFKNLGLVYCDYSTIDTSGNLQYKNYKAPLDPKRMRGVVFGKLLERNQITSSGSGVLVKKSVFEEVGLFDENLRFGEDWDMWLRISQKFEVDFSTKTLVYIRKHPQNMTNDPSKTFANELIFYKKWLKIIDKKYPSPLFWADKITFRIISQWPKKNLISMLESVMSKPERKKIFRKSNGSVIFYLPIFLLRQIYNIIFYPNYLSILIGLIKHKGK